MLFLQDPTDVRSTSLLDTLLSSFQGAERISGAFAFVSSSGVQLVTNDAGFRTFIQHRPMSLIIGIDAVTNRAAIDSLRNVSTQFSNFSVRAFFNPRPGAIFHPKTCWVQRANGGRIISGSGNLTAGGLIRNWEAYYVADVDSDVFQQVNAEWERWLAGVLPHLRNLDDPAVLAAADRNSALAIEGDLPTVNAGDPSSEAETSQPAAESAHVPRFISEDSPVLIAEIPKTQNRLGQANFHRADYEGFFGVQVGQPSLCVFGQVNAAGSGISWENNRQSITAQSRNFRFELAGMARTIASDVQYPVGVFIRVGVRAFLYRVFHPSDDDYDQVETLLPPLSQTGRRLMRTRRLQVEDLIDLWPTAPFWTVPSEFSDGTQ